METIPLAFLTSFFVVLLSTPAVIKVALLKRLFDEPNEERKLHSKRTPTIGGTIIFAGSIFAFSLWFPIEEVHEYSALLKSMNEFKYLIATILILFFVGIKDDIIGTAAVKKLIAHIVVGMVLVLMAEIRITGLHGIFGIREIPEWASIFLTLFTYIVIVNAFNLIDGVDGLAAGIGLIAAASFGTWFILAGDSIMACMAFSLAGALLAFLIFNFSPAKIFMGDSGSLSIGLIISILSIKLIEFDKTQIESSIISIPKPVFAMAVLAYPLFDTLRVFIYRTIRGLSPFSADRNHIHHKLIDIGFNHSKTVLWIYSANFFLIALCVLCKDLSPNTCLFIVGISTLLIAQIPFILAKRKKNKQ